MRASSWNSGLLLALVLLPVGSGAQPAPEKRNWFDDPFFQVASGIAGCPVPEGPLVEAALKAVPGMAHGSVWVTIQRRWVFLEGCVPSAQLARELERAAASVPEVETVVPLLGIGPPTAPGAPAAR